MPMPFARLNHSASKPVGIGVLCLLAEEIGIERLLRLFIENADPVCVAIDLRQ